VGRVLVSDRRTDIRLEFVHLTHLIIALNAAVDTGKYAHVTIDDVKKAIDDGTIVPYIQEVLADAQIMRPTLDESTKGEITAALQSLLDAYGGDERRKWGVQNSGLNLLLAWIFEMVQQGVRQETVHLDWARR
jgi:hypothetical protein